LKCYEFISRNIYGQVKEFQNASFGVEVYILADMLQIKLLIQDLDEFFKEEMKTSEIFAIFDLYLWLGGNKKMELERCKRVIILFTMKLQLFICAQFFIDLGMGRCRSFSI
jgi:hypothetical protein